LLTFTYYNYTSASFDARTSIGGSVLIIKNNNYNDKVEAHVTLIKPNDSTEYTGVRIIDPRNKDEFGSLQIGSNIPVGGKVKVTINDADKTENYELNFTGPAKFEVVEL
jgi:hypothetical protein